MIVALLGPLLPWIAGGALVLVLSGGLWVRSLLGTVESQREEIGAREVQMAAARARSDALAHDLEVSQGALLARDRQLRGMRQNLASSSAQLRRATRRPDVEKWARVVAPAAVERVLAEDDARGDGGATDTTAGAADDSDGDPEDPEPADQ